MRISIHSKFGKKRKQKLVSIVGIQGATKLFERLKSGERSRFQQRESEETKLVLTAGIGRSKRAQSIGLKLGDPQDLRSTVRRRAPTVDCFPPHCDPFGKFSILKRTR